MTRKIKLKLTNVKWNEMLVLCPSQYLMHAQKDTKKFIKWNSKHDE